MFQEKSGVQDSVEGEALFTIRAWPRACVHGREKRTKDLEVRRRTRRSKVAPLTARAAVKKCQAPRTVLMGWLCSRTIPYDGTIIRRIYSRPSRRCYTRNYSSTWPWSAPRLVSGRTRLFLVPAGKETLFSCRSLVCACVYGGQRCDLMWRSKSWFSDSTLFAEREE